MKKRMRMSALAKEVKVDLRDLGSLVYNAMRAGNKAILDEEEVANLVETIEKNKIEVEKLRDSISRISRARKVFKGGEEWPEDALFEEDADEDEDIVVVEPVVIEESDEGPPLEEPSPVEEKVEVVEEAPAKEEDSAKEEEAENAPEEELETPSVDEPEEGSDKPRPKHKRKPSTTASRKAAKKDREESAE